MDIHMLTTFFTWCTVINGALFIIWALIWRLAPDAVYRTQTNWAPISRETFNLVFYCFLGLFKIVVLVFNIVPYVALLIVG